MLVWGLKLHLVIWYLWWINLPGNSSHCKLNLGFNLLPIWFSFTIVVTSFTAWRRGEVQGRGCGCSVPWEEKEQEEQGNWIFNWDLTQRHDPSSQSTYLALSMYHLFQTRLWLSFIPSNGRGMYHQRWITHRVMYLRMRQPDWQLCYTSFHATFRCPSLNKLTLR